MTFARRHADVLASVLLVLVIASYAAWFVNFNIPPYEDAAMLMRYADHLAHGYGMVWNVGQHPVDGATDFLFTVAAAALIRIGLPVGRSIRAIGLVSHLLTVLLIYWANRRLWKVGTLLSFLCALYVAVGNGLSLVAAFFGTPFFAVLATLTWAFGLWLIQRDDAPAWLPWAFAFSGLLTGLTRPEGVILAVLMLLAVIVMRGWRASAKTIAIFAGVLLLLGGAYFAWRWSYFGYPLPNPFYKKGGGLLHWDSFWESLGNLVRFAGPFALAFVLGLRSRATRRLTAAICIPLVVFAAAFILVSNETNFGGRFQYALWPLVMISWVPLVSTLPRELHLAWRLPDGKAIRAVVLAAAALMAFALLRYSRQQSCVLTSSQLTCAVAYERDGRYDAAKLLSEYQGKGYVMATSEAGLLPFYSNWTAIDAWGLNDEWIAHHDGITAQYLDQAKPQLIVFHAYFSPLIPPRLIARNMAQDWFRMTITLKDYAESHGYVLAAAFGDSPYETHYYYVRQDFPDAQRITRELATMTNYYWVGTGRKSVNYAGLQP